MSYFKVEKQYNYLGEVPKFRDNGLPIGYLIDKGKVGCGGTSLVLDRTENAIICVPFVSLIKNKMEQYNKDELVLLGVYSSITNQDIDTYITERKKKEKPIKIICTYDSLSRVASVTGYDYYLLVDELHLLFIQYVFRDKAIRYVLNEYTKFRE